MISLPQFFSTIQVFNPAHRLNIGVHIIMNVCYEITEPDSPP